MSTSSSANATQPDPSSDSIDPIFHLIRIIPFYVLRPPRLRLKLPSFTLPSAMTVLSMVLLTYFMVVSGIVYDVIVEPPGIGSTQDRFTGSVRPVVFLPGRVNGQYIIEGLSSGFMFVLGGIGIVLLDLALDKNRAKSVKVSYASAGVAFVVISYVMKPKSMEEQPSKRAHSSGEAFFQCAAVFLPLRYIASLSLHESCNMGSNNFRFAK